MPYAATTQLLNSKIKPVQNSVDARMASVRLPGGVNYAAGQILEEVASGAVQNAAHTITFGGTPSGGTFTLTYTLAYGPKATAAITYSGTAATMRSNLQTALDNLLGAGNTAVTGSGPYTITYQNDLGNRPIAVPTATSSLTGTSPTVTPASSVTGQFPNLYYQAYTTGPARAILEADTQTDLGGNIINEHGASSTDPTAPAWIKGDFLCSDLVGLDDDAVTDFGKIVYGASRSATGAILRIT